jgi:hypothetical protein
VFERLITEGTHPDDLYHEVTHQVGHARQCHLRGQVTTCCAASNLLCCAVLPATCCADVIRHSQECSPNVHTVPPYTTQQADSMCLLLLRFPTSATGKVAIGAAAYVLWATS